jgi:hypothetical protein
VHDVDHLALDPVDHPRLLEDRHEVDIEDVDDLAVEEIDDLAVEEIDDLAVEEIDDLAVEEIDDLVLELLDLLGREDVKAELATVCLEAGFCNPCDWTAGSPAPRRPALLLIPERSRVGAAAHHAAGCSLGRPMKIKGGRGRF